MNWIIDNWIVWLFIAFIVFLAAAGFDHVPDSTLDYIVGSMSR